MSLELGNIMFNPNVNQSYECPEYIIAFLEGIRNKLKIKLWNTKQEEIDPFGNTGEEFKNDTFEVCAYNWNDDECQQYNFKWNEIEISWYKYLGRDTTINYQVDPLRAIKMFEDCLKSLDKL